jgi:hypothetical protein
MNCPNKLPVLATTYTRAEPGIKYMIDLFIFPDILLTQEHWLTTDSLSKLHCLSDDYFAFGSSISNMWSVTWQTAWGTAALIHKKHFGNFKCLVSSKSFTVIACSNWLTIGVHIPSVGTNDRSVIYQDDPCEL